MSVGSFGDMTGSNAHANFEKRKEPVKFTAETPVTSNVSGTIKFHLDKPGNLEIAIEEIKRNFGQYASELQDGELLVEKLNSLTCEQFRYIALNTCGKIESKLRTMLDKENLNSRES